MIKLSKTLLATELANIIHPEQFAILCLGYELRGDDKIGIYIGEQLKSRLPQDQSDRIIIGYNTPINFLGQLAQLKPNLILVIDSVVGDFEKGKIVLSDYQDIAELQTFTTHYQGLSQIESYLENILNKKILIKILGISIDSFEVGEGLDYEIQQQGDFIVKTLEKIISLKVK